VRWKLKTGAWQQVYPGVYATFTGQLTRDAQLWAALLVSGPGAQLSHETAAEIHHLIDRQSPLIHVTIPAERRVRPPSGVAIHTSSHLVMGWREDLDEIMSQAAGGTHSALEYRYDRDVERAHGLPAASKQVPFIKLDGSTGRRDRCYEKYGLIVELDGKRYHPEERRRLDRDRDNEATATAGSTLRYDWDDVTRKRCASAAQVHAALMRRGYTGRLTPCSPTCGARA